MNVVNVLLLCIGALVLAVYCTVLLTCFLILRWLLTFCAGQCCRIILWLCSLVFWPVQAPRAASNASDDEEYVESGYWQVFRDLHGVVTSVLEVLLEPTEQAGIQQHRIDRDTPLLKIWRLPYWMRTEILAFIKVLDPSCFVADNILLLLLVSLVWSVSIASLLSRNVVCRRWLLLARKLATAPGGRGTALTMFFLGLCVVHDALARLFKDQDRYMAAAAAIFVGCGLCLAALVRPKLMRLATCLSILEFVGGGLSGTVSWRASGELIMVGLSSSNPSLQFVGRIMRFTICICFIMMAHGFGRLIGVPLLSHLSRALGTMAVTLLECGIVIPFRAAGRLLRWMMKRILQILQLFADRASIVYQSIIVRTANILFRCLRWIVTCMMQIMSWCAKRAQMLYQATIMPMASTIGTAMGAIHELVGAVAGTIANVLGFFVDLLVLLIRLLYGLLSACLTCFSVMLKSILCLVADISHIFWSMLRAVYVALISRMWSVWLRYLRALNCFARVYLHITCIVTRHVSRCCSCVASGALQCSKLFVGLVVHPGVGAAVEVAHRFAEVADVILGSVREHMRRCIEHMWVQAIRPAAHRTWQIASQRAERVRSSIVVLCNRFLTLASRLAGHTTSFIAVLWNRYLSHFVRACGRSFSPVGCFISTALFACHFWHKCVQHELSLFSAAAYVAAMHGSFSVGLLLSGRTFHRYDRTAVWGCRLEAIGAWLFLNLDLLVISTTWRLVKRAYSIWVPSLLAIAQHFARALHGTALHLEQVLDTIVRCTWLAVRSLWLRVLTPIVTSMLGLGWSVLSKIWRNPLLSSAAGLAVVVYAQRVHAGSTAPPDLYSLSLAALRSSAAAASSSRAVIVAGLGELFHRASLRRSRFWNVVSSMVRPRVADAGGRAWQLAAFLADRPLEMFADPAFATVAATVTMACSRVALWIVSEHSLTVQEAIELAARIGRTSQRVLFVPMLLSAVFSSISSKVAVGLLQVVGLPLLWVYVLASFLFFCGEIRGWRATSFQLRQLQTRRLADPAGSWTDTFRLLGDVPGQAGGKNDAICCICLEPLTSSSDGASKAADEGEEQEVKVSVRLELVNGPRSPWYSGSRDAELLLEIADCTPEGAAALHERTYTRSNSTANGIWMLRLWSARIYSVRLINTSRRTNTPLLLEAKLQVLSKSTEAAAESCTILDLQGGRSKGGLHFPGNRRRDPSILSELRLQGAPADPERDNQGHEAGVEELSLADAPPPVAAVSVAAPVPGLCVITRCGHAFHEPCISAWRQPMHRCPLCRELLSGRLHLLQALL